MHIKLSKENLSILIIDSRDYNAAGGVCNGSNANTIGGWKASDKECTTQVIFVYNIIEKGLCSEETIKSLANYPCFADFLSRKRIISRGILHMIFGMCNATRLLGQFTGNPRLNPLNDINVFPLLVVGGPPDSVGHRLWMRQLWESYNMKCIIF